MSPKLLTGAAHAAATSLLRAQTDERLMELAAAGHPAAFEAIVARHRPGLVRYCTRLVGPTRAEDAVQQALISAHAAMPTAQIQNLRAWLFRVAHNAALNLLRSARDEGALDDATLTAPDLAAGVEVRDRLRTALDAIAALPAPQRDALMLHAVDGRSHEEVAAALDLTPGAARMAVHRARTALRAAATAVTPYGLLLRVASAGPWSETGSAVPAAVTGGALASVGKLGVALVAAGAVAGGAATLPSVVERGHRSPSTGQGADPVLGTDVAVADDQQPAPSATGPVASSQAGRGARHSGRHGASSHHGRSRHGRSGLGSGDDGGSHHGSSGGSDDGVSGSGSDDHRSGGSRDDGSRSDSSDDDRSGSGTSGGGGDSSDGGSHDGSPPDGESTSGSGTSGDSATSGSGTSGGSDGTSGDSGTSGGGTSSDGGTTSDGGTSSDSGGSDDGLTFSSGEDGGGSSGTPGG